MTVAGGEQWRAASDDDASDDDASDDDGARWRITL